MEGKKYTCADKEYSGSTWKWDSGKEPTHGDNWEYWHRVTGLEEWGQYGNGHWGRPEPRSLFMRVEPDYTKACASVHYSTKSRQYWAESTNCNCKRTVVCVKCK